MATTSTKLRTIKAGQVRVRIRTTGNPRMPGTTDTLQIPATHPIIRPMESTALARIITSPIMTRNPRLLTTLSPRRRIIHSTHPIPTGLWVTCRSSWA